jgi:hypothetical protein
MVNIPVRVQRKRTAGYKHPSNTRYCGRGTIYGNPFVVGEKTDYNSCFCPPDSPCHVDVLIERLVMMCAPREYFQMELI